MSEAKPMDRARRIAAHVPKVQAPAGDKSIKPYDAVATRGLELAGATEAWASYSNDCIGGRWIAVSNQFPGARRVLILAPPEAGSEQT
jgi:hypothetical protein